MLLYPKKGIAILLLGFLHLFHICIQLVWHFHYTTTFPGCQPLFIPPLRSKTGEKNKPSCTRMGGFHILPKIKAVPLSKTVPRRGGACSSLQGSRIAFQRPWSFFLCKCYSGRGELCSPAGVQRTPLQARRVVWLIILLDASSTTVVVPLPPPGKASRCCAFINSFLRWGYFLIF